MDSDSDPKSEESGGVMLIVGMVVGEKGDEGRGGGGRWLVLVKGEGGEGEEGEIEVEEMEAEG